MASGRDLSFLYFSVPECPADVKKHQTQCIRPLKECYRVYFKRFKFICVCPAEEGLGQPKRF